MNYFLFYYTLVILLISIMTSAVCFSAYLVGRNKTALLCTLIYLFYFFDVALVFQNDHLVYTISNYYAIGVPFAAMLLGTGLLGCFWLICCNFLRWDHQLVRSLPPAFFLTLSLIVYEVMNPGPVKTFVFYGLRSVFYYGFLIALLVGALRLRKQNSQFYLGRFIPFYVCLWLFGVLPLIENIVFLLVLDQGVIRNSAFAFLPQRNFAENLLLLISAAFVIKRYVSALSIRFEKPPTQATHVLKEDINTLLLRYAQRHGLSPRETEVLSHLLDNKNNQEIATALHLAPSTVKRHVHHILQKSNHSNRQDLIQGFWKHA